MSQVLRNARHLGAIQNILSAMVFALLAAAHASAVVLSLGMRNEWSWFVSIHLNRITAPALDLYYEWIAFGSFMTLGLLIALCLLPLWAQSRHSWMGTSIAGHLALGTSVLLLSVALQRAAPDVKSASLGDIPVRLAEFTSTTTLLVLTVALGLLCIVNHIAFFADQQTKSR
jgi:hypothetical protein